MISSYGIVTVLLILFVGETFVIVGAVKLGIDDPPANRFTVPVGVTRTMFELDTVGLEHETLHTRNLGLIEAPLLSIASPR